MRTVIVLTALTATAKAPTAARACVRPALGGGGAQGGGRAALPPECWAKQVPAGQASLRLQVWPLPCLFRKCLSIMSFDLPRPKMAGRWGRALQRKPFLAGIACGCRCAFVVFSVIFILFCPYFLIFCEICSCYECNISGQRFVFCTNMPAILRYPVYTVTCFYF